MTEQPHEYHTQLRRSPLWITIAILSLIAIASTGIFYTADWGGWGFPFVFAGLVFTLIALGQMRPRSNLVMVGFLCGIGLLGASIIGAPSAWHAIVGKRTTCEVTEHHYSSSRSGSPYYHHTLNCDGRSLQYTDRSGNIGKTGEKIDMIVDRTNAIQPIKPSELSTRTLLAFAGVTLLQALLIVLTVTLPRLNKHARSARKVAA